MTTDGDTTEGDNAERSVTLIIPSVYHRARFVDRVLCYLSSSGLQCPIVVTDHSPSQHGGVIDDIVKRQRDLDIRLLVHPPDMHFLERLWDCARVAQTPFVHLHADDDFVVRPTFNLLIGEMQRRTDLAAAMGLNVHVTFETGELTMLPKTALQQARPFERLVGQLQNYSSVLYALRRREEFIESLSFAVERCPDVSVLAVSRKLRRCVGRVYRGLRRPTLCAGIALCQMVNIAGARAIP